MDDNQERLANSSEVGLLDAQFFGQLMLKLVQTNDAGHTKRQKLREIINTLKSSSESKVKNMIDVQVQWCYDVQNPSCSYTSAPLKPMMH